MATIKNWNKHPDKILAALSTFLVERNLFKVKLQATPFEEEFVAEKKEAACRKLSISEKEATYFVFTGETSNTTYSFADERINILYKDGSVKDISKVDNALIQEQMNTLSSGEIKKYYICYLK